MLKLNISGTNVSVTEALERHVKEKLAPLGDVFKNITKVDVILRIDNLYQIAEATVNLGDGRPPIFAKYARNDMYDSINSLSKCLNRQILEHKKKLQEKR